MQTNKLVPDASEESIRKVLVMPGTVLLREGTPGDSMMVVSKGPWPHIFCPQHGQFACGLHVEGS